MYIDIICCCILITPGIDCVYTIYVGFVCAILRARDIDYVYPVNIGSIVDDGFMLMMNL